MQLNTEYRRDFALLTAVKTALRTSSALLDFESLNLMMTQIVDKEVRDEALLSIIKRCSSETKLLDPLFPECLQILAKSTKLSDPSQRCIACCNAYTLMQRKGLADHNLNEVLLAALEDAWSSIDIGWHKVDIGFQVVRLLAEQSRDMAKNFMDKVENERRLLQMDSEAMAQAYMMLCKLAIRAYPGLFKRNLDNEDDFSALSRLINNVPSFGERAVLWAELSIRCNIYGRIERSREIVNRHVLRNYLNINGQDVVYKENVLVRIAPALYCSNAETALERVSTLSKRNKDEALSNISDFLLRKQPISDPYDLPPKKGYHINYDDAVNLCTLMDQMNHDSSIHSIVKAISISVADNSNRTVFSQEQIDNLAARMRNIMVTKLPDNANIRHQGYVILCMAEIARLCKDKNEQTWLDIIEQARDIPNIADRAFVLSSITEILPPSTSLNENLLKEAKSYIDQMPDIMDRLEGYGTIAIHSVCQNKLIARECIKLAMESTINKDDPDIFSIQQNLIDTAYKIDANFASTLANVTDKDTARMAIRQNIADRLHANDINKKIKGQKTEALDDSNADISNYPQATWMLLAELNAQPYMNKDFKHTRYLVKVASRLPISQSYPILAWVVQNAFIRHNDTDEAATYLRPMFDAMVLGTALAGTLASRSMKLQKQLHQFTEQVSMADDSLIVHEGERDKALDFLKSWYQSSVSDYLIICDPYFRPSDLEAIQLLCSIDPKVRVKILTCNEGLKGVDKPYEDSFRDYWLIQLAGSEPARIKIVVAGIEPHGKAVIHDRWWLSKNSGLDAGTSFNAWGGDKTFSIKQLTPIDSAKKKTEVDRYLDNEEIEQAGKIIRYSTFTF